jgi:RNA-directed DNA polymerase
MTRTLDEPAKKEKQMTAELATTGAPEVDVAGASSHRVTDWSAINWQSASQNVRRLQARIVKATKEKRWNKVKALQRLLTHSFSGKALAVRRVTENQGKNTPGVDKVTWNTAYKKINAVYSLRQRDYHPQPLRRVYIPKKNGNKRALGIPCMKDRAMQALYLLALDPVAETIADPNSYGFRPGRCTADAIEQCFTTLAQRNSPQWILEGDIKSCFDQISHEWLLTHIPMEKAMLKKWLKAGYIDQGILYPTSEGTPQGGIISPVIANMTLDGLETRLREAFPQETRRGGQRYASKVHLIRYADDFVITGRSKEQLEYEVKPLVEQFLRERGLRLSLEKTVITHIEAGFDFLGQNVRKYKAGRRHKLLIKPSKKNVHTFLQKIRDIVKANRALSAGKLIRKLNPMIKGWAYYHQHIVSKDTFTMVDDAIYQVVRHWMKRRHPRKAAAWLAKHYFTTIKGDQWVFYGTTEEQPYYLTDAAHVPIKRHIKIRGEANPYDPQWESYFEKRLDVKMVATLKGKQWLLHLWKEQDGLCPVCHQKITTITGWHSHHLLWRSRGGSDTRENRVLLHPTCHQQVHSQGISVTKPPPLTKKGG